MNFLKCVAIFILLFLSKSLLSQSNCILEVKADGQQSFHQYNIGMGPISTAVYFGQGNNTTALSYQWYINYENKNTGGKLINGATDAKYIPSSDVIGTFYYYCVVKSASISACGFMSDVSNPVTVTVLANDESVICIAHL